MAHKLFAKKPLSLLHEEMKGENRLKRVLGPVSLTSLGIGCIIGAGIFVVTGMGAHDKAGPALLLSFVVAGIACVFSALCYAEFASMAPVAGSAYTYAYATLGEMFAWIIGWDLVLEYAVASASVAQGWSGYFMNFLGLLKDKGIIGVSIPQVISNTPFDVVNGVPVATHSIINLPAILLVAVVTTILIIGIKESTRFNNAMVIIKLLVVLFVIAVGAFYVNPSNWRPFAPFGYGGLCVFGKNLFGSLGKDGLPVGMLAGAAMIFFAYIGFDSVSTHAEEAKRPQRDVPIGIMASLAICTVLYIGVTAVLTGMMPYDKIDIKAPVAAAFQHVGLPWAQFIIGLGALAGLTSVVMVLMLSLPRVLLAMSRDGLLPQSFFGAVHSKFRTPYKSTILTGVFVAFMSALIPLRILAELVNIGTLLAFVIVCLAVLIMRKTNPDASRPFRCPMVPLIPILGILFCLLLMFSLPAMNWLRLAVWLAIGFIIYFSYGRHHSVLERIRNTETSEPAVIPSKK